MYLDDSAYFMELSYEKLLSLFNLSSAGLSHLFPPQPSAHFMLWSDLTTYSFRVCHSFSYPRPAPPPPPFFTWLIPTNP